MKLVREPTPIQPPQHRIEVECQNCKCVWDAGHEDIQHHWLTGTYIICGRCRKKIRIKDAHPELKEHAKTKRK